jgi:hypothetical protein
MVIPKNHRLANQVKHGRFTTSPLLQWLEHREETYTMIKYHNTGRESILYFSNFKIVNFFKKEHMHTETIYLKYNTEEQFHCIVVLKIQI